VKKFAVVFLVFLALAALIVAVGAFRTSSQRARASTIKIGDSKADVEQLLGSATMVTPFTPLWRTNAIAALFCDTAETWAYGSHFDFSSQFPWLRLRLFLPASDDIAVEFSSSGRVVRVTVPPTK
jgi:hypothetical protein